MADLHLHPLSYCSLAVCNHCSTARLSSVCHHLVSGPGPGTTTASFEHAGRHHSTTTTATLVAHALRLILARRPGPHSFTGNSIRRRRTYTLALLLHHTVIRPGRVHAGSLDRTIQYQARAGHLQRQQEAALRGTTPSDRPFSFTPPLVKHTTHVFLHLVGFCTDFRDFHLHSPDRNPRHQQPALSN